MNEKVISIYQKNRFYDFENFLKNMKYNKNIIYTFSKITEDLLYNEQKEISNKLGKFDNESLKAIIMDSIKSENDLIYLLKTFYSQNNKKILVLKISEKEFNLMNSVSYIISNFEKESKILLKEKIILFTVHMKRELKKEKPKNNIEKEPDFISPMNDDYYQIFIDNFNGKEKYDIFSLLSEKNEILSEKYLKDSNFIDNKIYLILYKINMKIINERDEFNLRNCYNVIAENVIENKYLKDLILINLKKQGSKIKEIVNEVFTADIIESNVVDFYDIINTLFDKYFSDYLLSIIYDSIKEDIFISILDITNLELLLNNVYFKDLIRKQFDKINFDISPKKIKKQRIYYGFKLPKCKKYFDNIINYMKEQLIDRFILNEELIRKENINNYNSDKLIDKFNNELDRIKENLKVELYRENNNDFFNAIFNQKNNDNNIIFKEFLLKDYLNYFIIKCTEKNEGSYKIKEKFMNILLLILKINLDGEKISLMKNFEYTLKEFIDIILFTQAYLEDLKDLFNIFIVINEYCNNFYDIIRLILEKDSVKFGIKEEKNKYSKLANYRLIGIVESFIKALLIYSEDLISKNKNSFHEYLKHFVSIEAIFQKMNKKYSL